MLPDNFPTHLFPFASHGCDISGLRMHYVDEGGGRPVVLVHGNPTWSFYYRNLISALAPQRRVLAPDHIGMGFSDHPTRDRYPFTLEQRIADFSQFIDSVVGETIVDLVVHDWGGAIGLGWAVAHPDRVGRIVISNTAAFHVPEGQRVPPALSAARSAIAGETVVRGANAFVEGAVRVAVSKALSTEEKRGYRAPYFSWKRRLGVFEFVRDIPVNAKHRSHQTLSSIDEHLSVLADHEILLAWGLKDFVFDAGYLAEFQRRFPQARTLAYPDSNHLLLDDERDDLINEIAGFLQ